jgi:aryl-alcohol dehydrogenase-like predicted oxidoreductase
MLTGKYLNDVPADSRLGQQNMAWLKDRMMADTVKIEKTKKLDALAKELGISLTHMSLCWCLKNPNVTSVILGASKVAQLEDNLKCYDAMPKLTTEVMDKIEAILQNKPKIVEF